MLKFFSLFAIAPKLIAPRPIALGSMLALLAWGSFVPPSRASTFDDYKASCIQRARQQGLTQEVALEVCNCTIKTFKSRYTLQQFQDLVKKSKKDKAAERSLRDVGEECFDSVLYEN